jgi:hypothetical protein
MCFLNSKQTKLVGNEYIAPNIFINKHPLVVLPPLEDY